MGCLRLEILEQSFVPMQIVYKRALGIDPLADQGGQQTLSPYHAMGCNPALMVDPLGLQAQPLLASPYLALQTPVPPGYYVDGHFVTLSADRLNKWSNAMEMLIASMNNAFHATTQAQKVKDIYDFINDVIAYGGGESDLKLQGKVQLSPTPKGQKQKGSNDCVYTVLSMISEVYGDNFTAKHIKKVAIRNGLGTKNNGVPLSNIAPLAALLGYQTSQISFQATINGSDVEVLSLSGARRMYNSLKQNRAVVVVESVGNNRSHSNLIYASERWDTPNKGGNQEFRNFSISTATGTISQIPFLTMSNSYSYYYAFVLSIYK
ncbi:MAG TPA: hypothetical protein PKX92_01405 [Edaphocola sp.]|nr:hypothetical protein [Edaphocola sp.]